MNKFLKVCAMALVFAGAISDVEGLEGGKAAPAQTLGTPVNSDRVECEATISAEIDASFEGMKKKLVFFENNRVTGENMRTLEFTVNSIGSRHRLSIVPTSGIKIVEGSMYLVQDGVDASGNVDDGQRLPLTLQLTDGAGKTRELAAAADCFLMTDNDPTLGKWKLVFNVPAVEEMDHCQRTGDYKGSVQLSFIPLD